MWTFVGNHQQKCPPVSATSDGDYISEVTGTNERSVTEATVNELRAAFVCSQENRKHKLPCRQAYHNQKCTKFYELV
jgi:hypothetical protein